MRKIAQYIYTALGWEVVGEIPHLKKMVVIAAPHTSWHDFYMGLLFRQVVGLNINFIGKKELFRWPFGWYFKKVGGVALDRTPGQKKVQAIAAIFKEREEFRLTIAPEGTRKKVEHWKTGFYYIAVEAQVPIIRIAMDFKNKKHRIAPPFYPTGSIEQDLPKIREFFKGIEGKIPAYS